LKIINKKTIHSLHQIDVLDYNKRKDGQVLDFNDFYDNQRTTFQILSDLQRSLMFFISGHFHANDAPVILSRDAAIQRL
jgi:hypothetical protein